MKNNLKILRIIQTLNPEYGGPANAIIDSSIVLQEKGYKVDILTYDSQDKIKNINKKKIIFNSYLGPSFNNNEVSNAIKNTLGVNKKNFMIKKVSTKTLIELTAKEISKGAVVGFFQGRMEWGARALGNRSILCDPRNPNIRDLLNKKIKKRESFRPFAPSILVDDLKNWFYEFDEVPHMMQVHNVKESKKKIIPAVTHIDGTGRLQTVSKKDNIIFYNLIKEFKKITKIPILLNTSFNENEPIVCNPTEAIKTFSRTKMDMLVIENWIIKR